MTAANPLLTAHELPPFSLLEAEHVLPALDTLLARYNAVVEAVAADAGTATWDSVMAPLEQVEDEVAQAFSPVSHLAGVRDRPEWREVYRQAVERLTEHETEVAQHAGLHARYQALRNGRHWAALTPAEQTAVDNVLRDGRLAGIDLPADQQARFRTLMSELASLSNRFSEQLLDATQGWTLLIEDRNRLDGLPESALDTLAANAEVAGKTGWLINLEFPSYLPVMTYANDRALRREVHAAFNTRASDQGPQAGRWDNSPLMADIMDRRHEAARMLGYAHYAEEALETRMASSVDEVLGFLHQLADRALPQAREEFAELEDFARSELGLDQLESWDLPWASEQLKQARYALSDEQLKPWFPVDRVLSGLFELVRRLYHIDVVERQDFDTYHPDVRLFELQDQGQPVALFYLDPYARQGKRGGAWMDDCRIRRRTERGLQLPVAYLTCNFTAPVGGRPGLLTHDEVTTLFHEFGHGLHHMLTQVEVGSVSGINGVAWDAVELPSQFMENFCWEPEALAFISGHVDTGEPLPQGLLERMLRARNFQSALQMMRQLEFSLFDFELHANWQPGAGVEAIRESLRQVRERVCVVPVAPYARFENSFGHIFSGGYAAGYYSYKWAEVLSADAFARFEEEGIFAAAPAQDFRDCILAQGGARPAAELYRAFRGRDPQIDALLRHSGITTRAA
ncbi:M3 family peptidase [Natronospirillum operosum]|uniref:oligopeptidase A n=1 Tax=Natronospirillum operosum TaxID=2759953 RepID=A0A4Z0WBF5_9GAMM|nr:M3 family metallopeptidase [Natronospirillum operosum]TGG91486.1 M3 family peptidase [Natronospirillum operosum]